MPKFLEKKLEHEYAGLPKKEREHDIFGTMNKIGAMRGSKETAKGKAMEKKHSMAHKMRKEGHAIRHKVDKYQD